MLVFPVGNSDNRYKNNFQRKFHRHLEGTATALDTNYQYFCRYCWTCWIIVQAEFYSFSLSYLFRVMEIHKEKTNKDAAAEINLTNDWTCSSLFGVDATLDHEDLIYQIHSVTEEVCNYQREKRSTVNILAKNKEAIRADKGGGEIQGFGQNIYGWKKSRVHICW